MEKFEKTQQKDYRTKNARFNRLKKQLNEFYPWVSKFRIRWWLWHANAFVLILLWYNMWRHYICCDHWHIHFQQLGQVVRASAQSI